MAERDQIGWIVPSDWLVRTNTQLQSILIKAKSKYSTEGKEMSYFFFITTESAAKNYFSQHFPIFLFSLQGMDLQCIKAAEGLPIFEV